ncbi:MAG: hemerythrin [Clostridiales bacterium]|nr:hemerythrin [Clostridiales bacterium]PZN06988.1 MAG: hemerythrin [Caldicoprobacter oshimai]
MSIKWRPELEIGIEEIDRQHKALINAVNDFLQACAEGKGKEEVGSTMDFLSDYVVTHFNYEQDYQKKYDYPKYEQHLRMHQAFLKEVENLKKKFEDEGASLHFTIQFSKKVVNWIITHIGGADAEFAAYVKSLKNSDK